MEVQNSKTYQNMGSDSNAETVLAGFEYVVTDRCSLQKCPSLPVVRMTAYTYVSFPHKSCTESYKTMKSTVIKAVIWTDCQEKEHFQVLYIYSLPESFLSWQLQNQAHWHTGYLAMSSKTPLEIGTRNSLRPN